MSNKKLFLIFFAILVGFLISMTFNLVFADMQVELKDGRTVSTTRPPSSTPGMRPVPIDTVRIGEMEP